jgi:hypothetical protein
LFSIWILLIVIMDNDGFVNEDNGGFGNEDGGFGDEYNETDNEEDNDRDVLNEYLLERMPLDDVGWEDDDEVSVGVGSGGSGSGADEDVASKYVDVAVAAVMENEAVGLPFCLASL